MSDGDRYCSECCRELGPDDGELCRQCIEGDAAEERRAEIARKHGLSWYPDAGGERYIRSTEVDPETGRRRCRKKGDPDGIKFIEDLWQALERTSSPDTRALRRFLFCGNGVLYRFPSCAKLAEFVQAVAVDVDDTHDAKPEDFGAEFVGQAWDLSPGCCGADARDVLRLAKKDAEVERMLKEAKSK